MLAMSTDILLVEDDPRIRQVLELALRDHGYDVRSAATGEQALEDVALRRPDVLLLDLMLPGIDGLEVCRRLRAQGDLPIIAVTARSDSADVVAGLEAGADDYVTKPVVAGVLAARIRAVLRRVPERSSSTRIGDLDVLTDRAVVLRRGEELPLTRTEYRLLCELAEHPGAVKTREELLHDVWGYDYFGDTRLLDVHVRRLRVKVEEDPGNPQLVLTVRGIGYRLAV
jgi:two-component system, OmpR family, response regulator MtrA